MIIDSGLVTGSLQVIGNTTMTGSLSVTGDINGNLKGNAQNATSASYAVTASYAHFAATPTVQGVQGTQGLQGLQGRQGTSGVNGSQGTQGLQGLQGRQGTTGIQGTSGTNGSQGITGAQGAIGSQGTSGTNGAQGIQGMLGNTGAQGTTGATGAQGTTGSQGITGSQGTTGSTGAQGAIGAQGTTGTTGSQGTTGSTGSQGATGSQGTTGQTGAQGTQGIQGTAGSNGAQGATGAQGSIGNTGAQGVQGIQGTQGVQGTNAGITSYTNASDNRVLTSVNSSTINAEANLIFDGTSLVNYGSESREVSSYLPASYTTNDLVSGTNYKWYLDVWRLGATRSGGASAADFVIQLNGSNRVNLNTSGDLTTPSSMRSPIFYDSANTSYYLDPSSTSYSSYNAGGARFRNIEISNSTYTDTIQNVTSGGNLWLNYGHNGNVGLAYGGGKVGVGTIGTPTNLLHVYNNSDVWHVAIGGASGELRIGGQTSSGAVVQAYTPGGVVRDLYLQRDGGTVYMNGYTALHANNYASYLGDYTYGNYRVIADYTSNSTWYIRSSGAKYVWARAHDWSQSFNLDISAGTSEANNTYAFLGQQQSNGTNGTWRGVSIRRYTGGANVLGDLEAGNMYSTIFYDANNTGYYVDPASTSNLNGLTVAGTISGSISGTARKINIGSSATISDLNISTSDAASVTFDTYNVNASNQPVSANNANGVITFSINHGPQYGKQIAFADNDNLYIRRLSANSYASWLTLLHSSNYNSYAPTLTGGNASGTWGIAVTGNAGTATTLQTARNINGTSFNGAANIDTTEWFHSDRDFPNGTLITTSINYANSEGDPFVLEIRGNTYGNIIPHDIQVQGYIYANTLINVGGLSNGRTISGLVALNVGGNLCFWFPSQGYWNGYNVKVYTAYATRAINKVTSITGTTKPSGTKEVALTATIRQSLHSDNYNSYTPTLTGTGASGNWGINVTGTSSNITSYTINQNVGTGNAPTFSEVYTNGWFRNNDSNEGLYNQTTTQHWSSNTNGYWDASSTTSVSAIRFWTGGHVSALRGYVYANNSNEIGFLNSAGNWSLRMDNSGNAVATGDVTAYSDSRVKENVNTLENALQKVTALRGVSYTRIDSDDKKTKIGVIAQEILEVVPEVVGQDSDGMYNVAYGNLAGLFIECIKEQQTQIDELKQLVKQLTNK